MLAAKERDLTFIGRCGTYQYLDMDQVVSQTLTVVQKELPRLQDQQLGRFAMS
jgi:UDP-galactopyranose mutase